VTAEEYRPERVVLLANAESNGALVLTDEYAPGWSATIDGQAAPIFPTWITLRGVEIPRGEHRVTFKYRTPRLGLAVCSGVLPLVLSFAAWLARGRTH